MGQWGCAARPVSSSSLAAHPSAEWISSTTENLGEDITSSAEVLKNTSKVCAPENIFLRKALSKPGLSEAVVLGTLVRVTEHRVGLADLFELLFRVLRALVVVGVMLESKLAVSPFDLVLTRISLNTQNFVVVTAFHVHSHASNKKKPLGKPERFGGVDGTRTRGLRLDRPAL